MYTCIRTFIRTHSPQQRREWGRGCAVVAGRNFLSLKSREEETFLGRSLLSVSLASADVTTAGTRSSLVGRELMSGAACRPYSVLGPCSRWEQQVMQAATAPPARLTAPGAALALSSQKRENLGVEFFTPSPSPASRD